MTTKRLHSLRRHSGKSISDHSNDLNSILRLFPGVRRRETKTFRTPAMRFVSLNAINLKLHNHDRFFHETAIFVSIWYKRKSMRQKNCYSITRRRLFSYNDTPAAMRANKKKNQFYYLSSKSNYAVSHGCKHTAATVDARSRRGISRVDDERRQRLLHLYYGI